MAKLRRLNLWLDGLDVRTLDKEIAEHEEELRLLREQRRRRLVKMRTR